MKSPILFATPQSVWSNGVIFGLGDAVEDALILNQTLRSWREDQGAIHAASGASVTGPVCLVGDDLWVSRRALPAWAQSARKALSKTPQRAARLVRPVDGAGGLCDPLRRLPQSADKHQILFDVWYIPEGVSVTLPSSGDALPLLLTDALGVDFEMKSFEKRVSVDPEMTGADEILFSLGPYAVVPVSHWVELHRANLLAVGTGTLEQGAFKGALVLFWAVVRAMSVNRFRVAKKLTRIGKRCVIHPSAVLEGCILGDDVTVDAGAVLRGCILGNGVKVGVNCIAEFSIFGERAQFMRKAMANLCVIYPEARVGGIVQLGLVGRKTNIKMFCVGTDMRVGGPVRVLSPSGLLPVDTIYHGVCFGHASFIASGIWIAPGRIIEAKQRVFRDPSSVVT